MKLVFPILRMNWYRVVSTTIDEALAAGHEVECWHDASRKGENTRWWINQPSLERVPHFRNGKPFYLEYDTDAAFLHLLKERCPDAVISISIPWDGILPAFTDPEALPPWVAMATNDTFSRLEEPSQLTACSMILVRTPHERDCVLKDHTSDVSGQLNIMESDPARYGTLYLELMRRRKNSRWTVEMSDSFHKRTVATGYALMDSVKQIDRDELRARWKIPPSMPVVGLLSSPFGSHMNTDWERAFACEHPLWRRWWNYRWRGLPGLVRPLVNEADVLRGIRRFCDRNGAVLVTKMRHSQAATRTQRLVSDVLLGEEGYYPHTAVEMSVLSDLVIGFYTTGAPEAVASEAPFLDIAIPDFIRDAWEQSVSMFQGMFDWPGVARSMMAVDWVRQAPRLDLAQFSIDANARENYAHRYCGPLDGRHSQRVMRAVESLVKGQTPDAFPVDGAGFIVP